MKKNVFWVIAAVVVISIVQTAHAQLENLEGRVVIDGSSTVAPISMKAADGFSAQCPKVVVPVGISGTGGGFKRFTVGEIDISDASRPIKAKELAKCKENNVEFIELPIAYDGLTIITSKACRWTNEITVTQLKKIFQAKTAAKKWSDVDPSWPNETITIFAPGTDSGTFDYFKEVVAKKGSVRSDMSVSEDDNTIVQGVSQNKFSIGFLGAAYYFENEDKLKALAVVNPTSLSPVLPTPTTIENGSYAPFSRPLFIYINKKSSQRPEVKTFVNEYLKNASDYARSVGYVGLPADIYKKAKSNFRRRRAGTHYLKSDGEKRSGSLANVFKTENLEN